MPAISGVEPQGEVAPNIKEMYGRFMADLPHAENQRFLSPQVAEELDSVLGGVAAGTVTPEDALNRVQAATDLIERHTSRSRTFFRVMFFLPVVTSVSVVSIVWAQMYAPYYGIIQEYLKYLGVQRSIAPLAEPSTVIFALIVVNIWQWTGFSMIMYVAGINSIPSELFDAALIDGAHGFSLVTRIVVPLLSPVTRSLLLLGIIGTLQTFPIVYLMTDGGPDHASEIFGTFIFKEGFVIGDIGYSSALSTLVLLLALLLSVVQIAVLGSRLNPQTRKSAI